MVSLKVLNATTGVVIELAALTLPSLHLLSQADAISDMTFMLQKEVVDRLTASPGTRDWGRLSIMVQYHCQADYLFFVPPGAIRLLSIDTEFILITIFAFIYFRFAHSHIFILLLCLLLQTICMGFLFSLNMSLL